jgi:hypothetical protein
MSLYFQEDIMSRLGFLFIIILAAQICSAATIQVPADQPYIQAGIDAAVNGDTVLVAAGVYTGDGNRDMDFGGKLIVVKSELGSAFTTINCEGTEMERHRAFRFGTSEDRTAVVDGFTFTNGTGQWEWDAYKGGAMFFIQTAPTIKNCVFQNNGECYVGSALTGFDAGPAFINCTFKYHTSNHGGAIYLNGNYELALDPDRDEVNPEFLNCLFHDNIALGYGGALYIQYDQMQVYLTDCIFYNNSSSRGGAIGVQLSAHIYINNCTFADNTSPDGSAISIWNDDYHLIHNSIFAFNNSSAAITCDDPVVDLDIECCDIYGNPGGDWTGCVASYYGIDGNFSADPQFILPLVHDYRISPNSPCAPNNNECAVLIGAEGVVGNMALKAVIAIDRSGSMSLTNPLQQSRLERAKAKAHIDIDDLFDAFDPDSVEIAVMSFNADGIVLLQDFSIDTSLLHSAVDSILWPRHDTPLAAAMCQASCLLDLQGSQINFLYIYTDGLENMSQNFDMCSICEPCNQYMSSGWNYDCNPFNPESCTEWQNCLAAALSANNINMINYFGEVINPFSKGAVPSGLEDLYFLKATAEASDGVFNYYSDAETICGDANSDGMVNVSDAVHIINYVFAGGSEPIWPQSADVNCDSITNVSDAVYLINFVFTGGPDPCSTCQ